MNRDTGIPGLIFVLSLVGAALFVIAAAAFATFAFLALALSVCSLFAWDRRLTLFGAMLEPEDARAFVKRGLVGTGLMCAFAQFCSFLYGISVRGDAWLYIVIAGYTAGSVGVGYLQWQAERENAGDDVSPFFKPHVIDHEAEPAQPKQQARDEPFRFATWDDEIELNKPDDAGRCHGCAWNNEGERPMPGASLR